MKKQKEKRKNVTPMVYLPPLKAKIEREKEKKTKRTNTLQAVYHPPLKKNTKKK